MKCKELRRQVGKDQIKKLLEVKNKQLGKNWKKRSYAY